ncbi:heparinase II/III family protein [Ochrobactrum chromiisoli]|uniref:Alginate lyase family protein n=1 Tax=Ochrobactrum chromiisoli TaxID=2993941 RepID=A0ABT3QP46_9HYPH|nr:alginate lyase family protein [Ochrobactrum chromiisoli]MCX2697387.1 alginate lyase family protein [Ochrobactrum chromiisoli]
MIAIPRLWRTVRYLKPIQIYGRVWFRLKKIKPDLSPAPPMRRQFGKWSQPAMRECGQLGPQRFRFLNSEHDLGSVGWDSPTMPKLWRYNLHYFNDLQAKDWQSRHAWHSDLIERWINDNAPGYGSGWEPYPLSLRIVNWIKWHLSSGKLSITARHSLAVQTRALSERLEWHLLGNHLFANAKALLFAGHFFEGKEAELWLHKAQTILLRQLDEQFLGDGGQFELSTMYHALALEDLLDILNLARSFPELLSSELRSKLDSRAVSAREWLDRLSHPDGGIAFFNDAAFGVAPDNDSLGLYSDALDIRPPSIPGPVEHLSSSGYVRLTAGPAVVIADFAEIGPDYLPGHAHADTLSFEFSCFGQRVFVNSGTGEYGNSTERLRQRGTAAHNTVVLNGQNSSEVWGGFRVGRRARVSEIDVLPSSNSLIASASHDGYSYLPGKPVHRRRFLLMNKKLRVEDQVVSSTPITSSVARLHLHPKVKFTVSDGIPELKLENGKVLWLDFGDATFNTETTTWHPEFGISETTTCLAIPLNNGRLAIEIHWAK